MIITLGDEFEWNELGAWSSAPFLPHPEASVSLSHLMAVHLLYDMHQHQDWPHESHLST